MATDKTEAQLAPPQCRRRGGNGVSSGVYGLGFVGAVIYYIQHAATFWAGVVGFCKAGVWPAFRTYKLLEFLKM